MSEYSEVKSILDEQGKKLDRLLHWAEGDDRLGTPSIAQQIERLNDDIVLTRKRTYENESMVRNHASDIEDLKKEVIDQRTNSSVLGAGGGGLVAAIIEGLRQLLT